MSRELPTLGLLPEKKRNWRTFMLGYSLCTVAILMILSIHLIWTDRMSALEKYTVIEIIPRPDLVPEKRIAKPKPKLPKLLPPANFEAPELIVPSEVHRPN